MQSVHGLFLAVFQPLYKRADGEWQQYSPSLTFLPLYVGVTVISTVTSILCLRAENVLLLFSQQGGGGSLATCQKRSLKHFW